MMIAKNIIRDWLIEYGYDGLCHKDCGCGINDLIPCDEMKSDCEPAYVHRPKEDKCERCFCVDNCEWKDGDCYYSPLRGSCFIKKRR